MILIKSMYNLYVGHWNLTTDILHNLRNAEIIPFSFYFISQTNIPCLNGVRSRVTKSPVCLNEETHSADREVTKKFLYLVKSIRC